MALRFKKTVQVCFYHERLRMKLLKRFIQLHYKVFENYFISEKHLLQKVIQSEYQRK